MTDYLESRIRRAAAGHLADELTELRRTAELARPRPGCVTGSYREPHGEWFWTDVSFTADALELRERSFRLVNPVLRSMLRGAGTLPHPPRVERVRGSLVVPLRRIERLSYVDDCQDREEAA
ncbi:hypothetical protein [Kribbella soli]|uniref:Uncharacterized protein n=1 Tax=Kribbella soli TaxID=1124743 RepID=A0A4R0GTT6_9ACTN|nr:hypothetical protein [Kribbella soli]TCC01335.1 hypothetical protein E0H45_42200 [Kribbella soli]